MNLNKVYNFFTLAPAILGAKYTDMSVKAILTSAEAIKYRDIVTLHEQMKPVIAGLPASVKDCTYYLLENISSGEKIVLANEYIDQSTILEVESVTINVAIHNRNTSDVAIIRARLLELGYTDIVITTS